jgi:hypothetical protein
MKTNPDREDTLLDAVLRDESWQTNNAAFKAEALGTFRTRQRVRRLTRWAGGAVVLAVVVAGAVHWRGRPTATPRQFVASRVEAPKKTEKPRYLTDEELLASFPKGSCFIAEVDGKKELVFFDPNVERKFVADFKTEK